MRARGAVDLDRRRAESVRKYLAAYTTGGNAPPFDVQIHNPPEVGMAGVQTIPAITQMYTTPRATLPGSANVTGGR